MRLVLRSSSRFTVAALSSPAFRCPPRSSSIIGSRGFSTATRSTIRHLHRQDHHHRTAARSTSGRSGFVPSRNVAAMTTEAMGSSDGNGAVGSSDERPPANRSFPEEAISYDTYRGVALDVSKLAVSGYLTGGDGGDLDTALFRTTMADSLRSWKEGGKRGIWVNVPVEHTVVVPLCVEMGFDFQYAKTGMLVLTKWLPEDCDSRLPKGPTHQVGVGALILHPITGKMLVVQEKSGPASVHKLWKMPTGLTDPAENIEDASVREVKEETGLDVTFDRAVCIRQAHNGGAFDQSDMFFVCLVRLGSGYMDSCAALAEGDGDGGDGIPLVPQEAEIADIRWMDMDEYSGQGLWDTSPLYREMNDGMKRVAEEVRYDRAFRIVDNDDDCRNGDGGENGRIGGGLSSGLISKTLPIGYRDGSLTILVSKM